MMRGSISLFLPSIRFGTERYPEKVARRLRALNLAAWIAAVDAAAYSIAQFMDPNPGMWKPATTNAVAALALSAVPLLHRFGSLAGPIGFTIIAYLAIFVDCALLGIGTGMQMYYLVAASLGVLFVGTDRIFLASAIGAVAAALIITLELFVPRTTGLQPDSVMFANFVGTVLASCVILLTIVFFALRSAANAEAAAEHEYERSEALLENVLPASITGRLKNRTEAVIADKYDDASILFADMAGFTGRTSDTAPDALVRFLNRVFTDFDQLVELHGLEKIKTTGDSYMVVSGVPVPRRDHAVALAHLALEMCDIVKDLQDPHGRRVPLRIGIASGPVVAGVIGTRKFFFDVWGDAVNVAARMEATGEEGKIQVSQHIWEHLRDEFVLDARGPIEVKGKGLMPTWFLVGVKPSVESAPSRHADTNSYSLEGVAEKKSPF
jgi:adenylate cyclase